MLKPPKRVAREKRDNGTFPEPSERLDRCLTCNLVSHNLPEEPCFRHLRLERPRVSFGGAWPERWGYVNGIPRLYRAAPVVCGEAYQP